jgi:MFS family permease
LTPDFANKNSFNLKQLIVITFTTSGILAWFFVLHIDFGFLYQNITADPTFLLVSEVLFFLSGAVFSLVGGIISAKVNRRKLLIASISIGVVSTGALAVVHGEIIGLILAFLLGLSFGLSFPSSVALFADLTKAEDRGKYAGFLVTTAFLLISLVFFIQAMFTFGLVGFVIILMLLRLTSFIPLMLNPCARPITDEKPLRFVLARRDFLVYLIPWLIFNLVSGLSNFIIPSLPQTEEYFNAVQIGVILQFLCVAIFSIVSGFMCDRVGRKLPVIVGIVLFGVSFAILAFALNPFTIILQGIIFGFAWGFCMVAYFAIPGDLAKGQSQEKYYAISSVLPWTIFMATNTLPFVLLIGVPAAILAPILSMLLFLSIIPILYAPESLPESSLNARRQKDYMRKLGKVVEDSKKNQ